MSPFHFVHFRIHGIDLPSGTGRANFPTINAVADTLPAKFAMRRLLVHGNCFFERVTDQQP
jgi:hypothetical protein